MAGRRPWGFFPAPNIDRFPVSTQIVLWIFSIKDHRLEQAEKKKRGESTTFSTDVYFGKHRKEDREDCPLFSSEGDFQGNLQLA